MGDHLEAIKDYLRGDNPRIRSTASMVKTTPPGRGSRLLRVVERNPLYELLERQAGGVRLLATGPFGADDLGVACYHAKTGAVELLLNHLVDGPGEYVVVDMTAGADCFASGLFTRFDRTFLVVEPTRKSTAVWRQYQGYARGFDVNLSAVGNKVQTDGDVAFLREQLGTDLLVHVEHSSLVRAAEQGRPLSLEALEAAIRAALERHFGVTLAFQNCHRVAVFPAGARTGSGSGAGRFREFTSVRAQLLNQSPELRDC